VITSKILGKFSTSALRFLLKNRHCIVGIAKNTNSQNVRFFLIISFCNSFVNSFEDQSSVFYNRSLQLISYTYVHGKQKRVHIKNYLRYYLSSKFNSLTFTWWLTNRTVYTLVKLSQALALLIVVWGRTIYKFHGDVVVKVRQQLPVDFPSLWIKYTAMHTYEPLAFVFPKESYFGLSIRASTRLS